MQGRVAMNIRSGNVSWVGIGTLAVILLAGCAAPKPKDFSGKWHPVNRFSSTVTPIPLQRPYTYFASPLDATLKTLLERWAKDTGMRVDYRLRDDFTLYTPVSAIHTADAGSALAQLNRIYAAQDVSITIDRGAFVVDVKTPTPRAPSDSASTKALPGPSAPPHTQGTTPPHGAG